MRFKSGNLDPANEPRGYPVNKIDDELKAIVQASARSSKICLKLTWHRLLMLASKQYRTICGKSEK